MLLICFVSIANGLPMSPIGVLAYVKIQIVPDKCHVLESCQVDWTPNQIDCQRQACDIFLTPTATVPYRRVEVYVIAKT